MSTLLITYYQKQLTRVRHSKYKMPQGRETRIAYAPIAGYKSLNWQA